MRAARTPAEVEAALALRHSVFCDEQGVPPEADRDGRDHEALHLVVVHGGRVLGTCRLLMEGRVARLGRMAVAADMRGAGAGTGLLGEADRVAASAGVERIRLHAQTYARAMYERAGYEPRGEPFLEEGIEHVTMEKRVA